MRGSSQSCSRSPLPPVDGNGRVEYVLRTLFGLIWIHILCLSNIWIKTHSVYDRESVIEPCSSVSANSSRRIQRIRDDPELTLLSIRAINTTCKSDRNMDIAGNGVDALDPRIQVIIIELLFQSLIRIAIDLGCLQAGYARKTIRLGYVLRASSV